MNNATPPIHQPPSSDPAEPRYIVDEPGEPREPGTSLWREFLSTVGILVTALGVALLIIAFVFRSYQVDGPSMRTTLENSDKLIIWKVPRTVASITNHPYIPKRGDIIVFSQQGLSEYGQEDAKQLIKRVIALPGEKVTIRDGHYIVTNAATPGGFDPDVVLNNKGILTPTTGNIDYTLKSDELFVSGDNRPDSLDSRNFGPIKAEQVIGKLVLRVFPIDQAKVY
jgi:signal peptidase I